MIKATEQRKDPNVSTQPPNYHAAQIIGLQHPFNRAVKRQAMLNLIRISPLPPIDKILNHLKKNKSKDEMKIRVINYLRHDYTNYDEIRKNLQYSGFDAFDLTIILFIEVNKMLCKEIGYNYVWNVDFMSEIKKSKYHQFISEAKTNYLLVM